MKRALILLALAAAPLSLGVAGCSHDKASAQPTTTPATQPNAGQPAPAPAQPEMHPPPAQ